MPRAATGDGTRTIADNAHGASPGAAAGSANGRGVGDGRAVQDAVRFILRSTANRPQTEAEVAARLAQRAVDEHVAEAALRRARELGAVDDAALAAAWVEDRGHRRGYGVARLRRELARRRVPDEVAEVALARLEGRDELAAATELARERFRQLPGSLKPEAVARRLVGYLARRGYPEGIARRAAITASGLDREWD